MTRYQAVATFVDANNNRYDKLVVGAIITKSDHDSTSRILLLKRAAHEPIYPNIFEIPGGEVETTDTTILDAVKREVHEETGLTVTNVLGNVESFHYAMEKVETPEGRKVTTRKTSMQLNFVCEVEGYDFRIDPREHSEGVWATKGEVAGLEVTASMREVVREAFEWVKARTG